MWKDVEACKDQYKKLKMKESIANLQSIVSPYLDATRYVIEKAYPNRRFKEVVEENGNNNNYYPDIDGSRISDNDKYRDPPPTVF